MTTGLGVQDQKRSSERGIDLVRSQGSRLMVFERDIPTGRDLPWLAGSAGCLDDDRT